MYRIMGVDGKEYGPVSAEVLLQWIGQGRANARTRARVEESSEWRELSSFPEFAIALGASPVPPVPPFQSQSRIHSDAFLGADAGEAMAREILANDYRFDIGACFSKATDLLASRFWFSVGAGALVLLITTLAAFVPFASLLLYMVFLTGLDWVFLKMLRGQPADFNDLFAGFSVAFVPLMLFSIVSQLLISVGFILCLLPGIYLTVVWFPLTGLIIMDKKLDFWPAMELARKVITRHWWHMFGLLLLCLLVNLLGTAALCIGFFITLPLTTIVTVVAYEQVFSRVTPGGAPAPMGSIQSPS
jgi:hypothetical protein